MEEKEETEEEEEREGAATELSLLSIPYAVPGPHCFPHIDIV